MKKGFSLIELMVVIAIIAILAAIALPLYRDFTCKTRANEPVKQLADVKAGAAAADGDFNVLYAAATGTDKERLGEIFNCGFADDGRWTFTVTPAADTIEVAVTDAGTNPSCITGLSFTYNIERASNGGMHYWVSAVTAGHEKYVKTSSSVGAI